MYNIFPLTYQVYIYIYLPCSHIMSSKNSMMFGHIQKDAFGQALTYVSPWNNTWNNPMLVVVNGHEQTCLIQIPRRHVDLRYPISPPITSRLRTTFCITFMSRIFRIPVPPFTSIWLGFCLSPPKKEYTLENRCLNDSNDSWLIGNQENHHCHPLKMNRSWSG